MTFGHHIKAGLNVTLILTGVQPTSGGEKQTASHLSISGFGVDGARTSLSFSRADGYSGGIKT